MLHVFPLKISLFDMLYFLHNTWVFRFKFPLSCLCQFIYIVFKFLLPAGKFCLKDSLIISERERESLCHILFFFYFPFPCFFFWKRSVSNISAAASHKYFFSLSPHCRLWEKNLFGILKMRSCEKIYLTGKNVHIV